MYTINKSARTKKVWKLNDPHMYKIDMALNNLQ